MAHSEFWLDVPDFDNYMVSSFGGVRNWKAGLELKPRWTPDRGYYVYLRKDGKNYTKFIHVLMGETFFHSWEHDCVVEHIDGDMAQNTLWNLRLTRPKKPESTRGRVGNPGDIRIVETGQTFRTMGECAKHIGGQVSGVSECLSAGSKRTVYKGCSFERVV